MGSEITTHTVAHNRKGAFLVISSSYHPRFNVLDEKFDTVINFPSLEVRPARTSESELVDRCDLKEIGKFFKKREVGSR